MLIDRTHRIWGFLTLGLFIVSTVLYVLYANSWPGGPSARSWPGMWFGVAATVAMVWAGLLAARKKAIALRGGTLAWWLKSHLWIGTLSLPLVCYHAAFRWGGTLEQVLWATYLLVMFSGFLGVALQNFLPRMMKVQLPNEAIPDQFEHCCRRLQSQSDEAVLNACGNEALQLALHAEHDALPPADKNPGGWLAGYYLQNLRGYLAANAPRDLKIADAQQATLMFERIRSTLPDRLHNVVDELQSATDQRRLLANQMTMHGWLHGWLRIHVPLSVALLVFTVVHIVTALYY